MGYGHKTFKNRKLARHYYKKTEKGIGKMAPKRVGKSWRVYTQYY